jgi:thiosulfate reductase cytochrome b subunit
MKQWSTSILLVAPLKASLIPLPAGLAVRAGTPLCLVSPEINAPTAAPHAGCVRCTHWIATVSFLLLVFSGAEILMVHPRLYWGDVGNDLTPAWIELPISRNYRHGGWEGREAFFGGANSPVSEARTFKTFNRDSWGRSLHFLAGWGLVAAGVVYLLTGIVSGHFRRHLLPRGAEMRPRAFWADLVDQVRLRARGAAGGPDYGLLQKCAYIGVVFIALPGAVLTGFAMSPAITAVHPGLLNLWGGFQSARTVHFFLSVALVLFLAVHVAMVVKSGFRRQMRAMTLGGKIT